MFYLNTSATKKGERLILLHFNYHSSRMKLSTGLSIHPANWDAKRHRSKRSFKYNSQFNALLDKFERVTRETYLDLKLKSIPTPQRLSAEVSQRMLPEKYQTVLDYAKDFTKLRGGMALKTRQAYSRVVDLIEEFNPNITFDQIDMNCLSEFRDFLLVDKKYEQNSAAKIFQRFKSIVQDATDRGINKNMIFKTRKVSINYIETTQIFLDEQELDKIWRLSLDGMAEAVKDAFIVSCYTGTRYSDIYKINHDSFREYEGAKYFVITDTKTSTEVQIPAHPFVLAIMDKYQWNIPRISNVKFNLYLKSIGEAAGIDQDIIATSYPGGVRRDTKVPKYAMITVHTGRRSLISNLILAGVDAEIIKKISGHRSHAAFLRYIKLTPRQHLAVAFRSEFFRAKLRVI